MPPTRLAFFDEHHRLSLWLLQVCCNLCDPNKAVLATQVLPDDLTDPLDLLDDLGWLIVFLITHG